MEAIRGQVIVVLSSVVIDETRKNLHLKAPDVVPLFEAFVTFGPARRVEPPLALVLQAAAMIAAKDTPIVAGAQHAGVAYLATYDRRHVLSKREEISTAFGFVVATANEILASFRRER